MFRDVFLQLFPYQYIGIIRHKIIKQETFKESFEIALKILDKFVELNCPRKDIPRHSSTDRKC